MVVSLPIGLEVKLEPEIIIVNSPDGFPLSILLVTCLETLRQFLSLSILSLEQFFFLKDKLKQFYPCASETLQAVSDSKLFRQFCSILVELYSTNFSSGGFGDKLTTTY